MIQKSPLQVLIIFLLFSIVLSSADAVPTTRSLFPKEEESSIKASPVKGSYEEFGNREDVLGVEDEFMVERRIDLQFSNDYPGTGANNRHDPKTPGRV